MGIRSGGPPRLAQRLPANQRAPEREERLVDVGPLVIPHAQTAKLIEPGKCPLHDPAPPAQSTPVRGTTHGEPRPDVPRLQSAPNRRRVVAAIPENTVRPLPRSPPFAVQRGNRIHLRESFLRVVPVRAGQANRERAPPSVANQMARAPALGPIGGIRTGLVTAVHRADGTTVHDRPRPINLVVACEPIQQREVNEIPHARSLPIAQAAPTRHSRPAPEFLREHVPGNAAAKDEDNAGQARAIRNARPPALWPTWVNR